MRHWLAASVGVLGVLLVLTVPPAPFTVDDNHYLVSALAAAEGRLTVASTAGLPPSRELLFFDPGGYARRVGATPVAPTVPPLYGWLAAPLTWLGWRGLVALNALSFAATAALVWWLLVRMAAKTVAVLGTATFLLGAFSLEYAQGLWPHSLAVLLTTAAVALVLAALAAPPSLRRRLAMLALAGALAGIATGMRYQNIVIAGCLALGALAWGRPRWRAAVSYASGLAVPLLLCSLLNHARHGSWNPISKGSGYLLPGAGVARGERLADAMRTAWFMFVDYSARPPLLSPQHPYVRQDPWTGAHLIGGVVKKALLQSAPWAAVALLVLVAGALPGRWLGSARGEAERRASRLVILVVAGVGAAFAAAGSGRTDGLCFNQRYLLELMPLLAIAFALGLAPLVARRRPLVYGGVGGLLLALAVLRLPHDATRLLALGRLPLVVALALALVWWRWRRAAALPSSRHAGGLAALAGLAVGWAAGLHLGADLPTAHRYRRLNAERAQVLAAHLPRRAALVAYWGNSDAAGPLLFDHDLLVLDPSRDGGADLPRLLAAVERLGRPLYAVAPMPAAVWTGVVAGRAVTPVDDERRLWRLDRPPAP
jgi:hypothetical protein